MKASKHGGNVPSILGGWSFNACGGELWSHDAFDTKEEAIAEGRAHFGPDVAFEVGQFKEIGVRAIDADDVISALVDSAYEEVPGEFADDYLATVTDAQRDELTAEVQRVVAAWLTKYRLWPECATVASIVRVGPVSETAPETT